MNNLIKFFCNLLFFILASRLTAMNVDTLSLVKENKKYANLLNLFVEVPTDPTKFFIIKKNNIEEYLTKSSASTWKSFLEKNKDLKPHENLSLSVIYLLSDLEDKITSFLQNNKITSDKMIIKEKSLYSTTMKDVREEFRKAIAKIAMGAWGVSKNPANAEDMEKIKNILEQTGNKSQNIFKLLNETIDIRTNNINHQLNVLSMIAKKSFENSHDDFVTQFSKLMQSIVKTTKMNQSELVEKFLSGNKLKAYKILDDSQAQSAYILPLRNFLALYKNNDEYLNYEEKINFLMYWLEYEIDTKVKTAEDVLNVKILSDYLEKDLEGIDNHAKMQNLENKIKSLKDKDFFKMNNDDYQEFKAKLVYGLINPDIYQDEHMAQAFFDVSDLYDQLENNFLKHFNLTKKEIKESYEQMLENGLSDNSAGFNLLIGLLQQLIGQSAIKGYVNDDKPNISEFDENSPLVKRLSKIYKISDFVTDKKDAFEITSVQSAKEDYDKMRNNFLDLIYLLYPDDIKFGDQDIRENFKIKILNDKKSFDDLYINNGQIIASSEKSKKILQQIFNDFKTDNSSKIDKLLNDEISLTLASINWDKVGRFIDNVQQLYIDKSKNRWNDKLAIPKNNLDYEDEDQIYRKQNETQNKKYFLNYMEMLEQVDESNSFTKVPYEDFSLDRINVLKSFFNTKSKICQAIASCVEANFELANINNNSRNNIKLTDDKIIDFSTDLTIKTIMQKHITNEIISKKLALNKINPDKINRPLNLEEKKEDAKITSLIIYSFLNKLVDPSKQPESWQKISLALALE